MLLSYNRKVLVIGIAIVLLLLIVSIPFQLHLFSHTSMTQGRDFNGNSVPEATLQPTAAAFVGYNNLLDNGVTLDQVNGLQTAFQHYQPLSAAGMTIDIGGSTLTPISPEQDRQHRPSLTATVVVNYKTTYPIKFFYWGTSQIELLIYDTKGKVLFDSGTIVGQS